jgi:hypothetical protein
MEVRKRKPKALGIPVKPLDDNPSTEVFFGLHVYLDLCESE